MDSDISIPEFEGFDWSGGNAEKNWKSHHVTPLEAEQMFFNAPLLAGTDAVAVDRIGLNIVSKKRIEMKLQKEESPLASKFLQRADELGLGISDNSRITLKTIDLA